MSEGLAVKDPSAVIDLRVDWAVAYLRAGESVTGSTWAVSPAHAGGVVLSGAALVGAVATVFASGGTLGRRYRITNRATISSGVIQERSFTIAIEEQ